MIAEWTHHILDLFNQVSEWSRQEGWRVESAIASEDLPDTHETQEMHSLRILTTEGRVHFEPAGRRADGTIVVDVYAWPTLVRVRLMQATGERTWDIVTDAGVPFHLDWNKDNFVRLVHDLQILP